MSGRFVTIWFPYLKTDWFVRRDHSLRSKPFVLRTASHGRMIVSACNEMANRLGIYPGGVVADAKAIFPELVVLDDQPILAEKLLRSFANYCIRFSPSISIDAPDGIVIDASGCSHLWGGDERYVETIIKRINGFGYQVKAAMADTIGSAWAVSRFERDKLVVENRQQEKALLHLPASALRLEEATVELLEKLGLKQVSSFIHMPRQALLRRFGNKLLQRLNQALGYEDELISYIHEAIPYRERLPCPELILTATGIEIALKQLLEQLCKRLRREQKGLREAIFTCYRIDGNIQHLTIGTNFPSHNPTHIFKLFELKLDTIEPALGIELFVMEANKVEGLLPMQEKMWAGDCGLHDIRFAELIDRITNRIGSNKVHRFLPDEHHWPERSVRIVSALNEAVTIPWDIEKPRPIQLLSKPERIQVSAPIPDYPPMLFRYKGTVHTIKRADGPERIEREWWIEEGLHRDYYHVEDEKGSRYWIFRSGYYMEEKQPEWFIHGFFA